MLDALGWAPRQTQLATLRFSEIQSRFSLVDASLVESIELLSASIQLAAGAQPQEQDFSSKRIFRAAGSDAPEASIAVGIRVHFSRLSPVAKA
jgi:hypothetical protein